MWEREREWRHVESLLRTVEGGAGGTLLVDGEPGAGRTRLLAEAAAAAAGRHITVVRGSPEDMGELIPCGMLFQALDLRFEPAACDDAGASRTRTLERLRAGFEERATQPMLAVLDDLHAADPMTLMVLRALHHVLAPRPIGWLLSRSTVLEHGRAAFLFDLLEREGATRVELEPLSPEAAAGLVTEALGVPPDPATLAWVVGAAGGNPLLINELLAGLRDEGLLGAVIDGADLPYAHVPLRLRMVVRRWIDTLSTGARNLVETVAVLGRSFSPEQAASLLGTTPAALLPLVEESMAAGILTADACGLTFRHELVRLVVATRVPQPLRHALLDQLGVRTRALPASRPPAGSSLGHVVAFLDTAIAEGRLQEAEQLVREGLADSGSVDGVVELRGVLSDILYLTGKIEEALREAETVLAVPDLPSPVRDRAVLVRLYALAHRPDSGNSVRAYAHEVMEGAARHGPGATVAALVALAVTEWDEGRLSAALAFAEDARRLAGADESGVHRYDSLLVSAAMLMDIHRLDEALVILQEARADMSAHGHLAWLADVSALEARAELTAGRFDSAVTEAERALDLATALGTPLSVMGANAVLATVALRRGDLRAATRYAMEGAGGPLDGQTRHALLTAQVAEVRDGPLSAMTLLTGLPGPLGRQRSMLTMEPSAGAWMVRIALATDDRTAAEAVVATAEALSRANPEFAVLVASAAHARGLLDGDGDALARAAEQTDDLWARASAAEDLGVLLVAAGRHADAAGHLDRALAIYQDIGSARDSARVRRRLRGMGVRHRHWSYAERPVTGWESLTETERNISLLVADGWTNRQVAEQTFISVHTVAFHLRHVYRKLQINSRIELVRLVVTQGRTDPRPSGTAEA
ncbi:AAA family ATPase [Nonomuraea sp. NPDC026600]|uniref:AAA family ATPase n=1 Tax=Nonomuraea sp. NPDC026600 TaxID=3155363 RepID=UPI00340DD220